MLRMINTIIAVLLMLAFTPLAMATESALPAPETLPQWVGYIIAALYALSHVVAMLPSELTSKLPPWISGLLQFVAANYGSAKNKEPDK